MVINEHVTQLLVWLSGVFLNVFGQQWSAMAQMKIQSMANFTLSKSIHYY